MGRGELRAFAQFEIVGAVLGRLGEFGAELEIPDRDLRTAWGVALVRALDDGDPALAAVGVFELRVHAARAEIELGRDPRSAQARNEPLIIRHRRLVAVEREHHHRTRRFRRCDDWALDRSQRRQEARDADRKAGRGNRLRAKPRHQPVVAAAAADRAEPDRPAVLARRLERQLGLEDRAGVIFKPAHDGGVDTDAVGTIASRPNEGRDLGKLFQPFAPYAVTGRVPNSASVDRLDARRRRLVADAVAKLHSPIVGVDFEPGAIHEREHLFNIVLAKPRALGEISALVLASGAEERTHALRPEPVELVDRPQHD